ncbi:hypothetical protein OAF32_02790 [Akkermansiaceae bacterium]|nr:hypothetical protein [Akkermansiaceae bacterium]
MAEAGLALEGLVIVCEDLMDHFVEIDVFRRERFIEGGSGNLGEGFEREILLLPSLRDGASKLIEIGIHEGAS